MSNTTEFDYIVVGGGSAGSVLASRLSESGKYSVGLFEAGGGGNSFAINTPLAAVSMLPTTLNNYAFETIPQAGLNHRKGYQPRGKCLGGSSAINAMIYTRGHPSDYDGWANLGNAGWSYQDLLPYFIKSECNANFGAPFHGTSGPLNVAHLQSDNPYHEIFNTAVRQAGFPQCDDFNGVSQEGLGSYQVTQINGERCSVARAYLLPHINVRKNLFVQTRVQVQKIIFTDGCATGISYLQGDVPKKAHARREILLCAGAIQSPQLLMLSGIGPINQLNQFGIPIVSELAGVGQNLQDHPDFIFGYEASDTRLIGISASGGIKLLREYIKYAQSRRGMFASNFAEAGGFLKTDATLPAPDIQLHFVVALVDDHARKLRLGHGYSCHVCVLRPYSRGQITLASNDIGAAPLIDPSFLADERDMDTMVRGFHLTRRLMDAPIFKTLRKRDVFTNHVHTNDEIREVIRQRADTVYHPVGTCKMGQDAMSVVDHELRVKGVGKLRVVDASIMPTLIGGNTNAPVIAIAEKAADMILKDSAS